MAAVRPRYEVCVESADGVRAALAAGADRVELCADLTVGGITPSAGLIQWAVQAASSASSAGERMRVHVLIRPRGGDFVYTRAEQEVMSRDIQAVRT
ncbi:MAG TPA: copper homeostasis protein CutC, partial [Trebonia sp.]